MDVRIEMLARMWMVCDPNRQPCDPDEIMEPSCDSDGNEIITDLTGKPRWHWFVPRAEASLEHIQALGYDLSPSGFAPTEGAA